MLFAKTINIIVAHKFIDKKSEEVTAKELIWDNKSQIMFDPKLIPAEMIRS